MAYNPFSQANQRLFVKMHHRWRKQQRREQILRSQVGFLPPDPSDPPLPCRGCQHYHGVAYGSTPVTRSRLICAIHPRGWEASLVCPDWQADS